jgi:hypothetical protein
MVLTNSQQQSGQTAKRRQINVAFTSFGTFFSLIFHGASFSSRICLSTAIFWYVTLWGWVHVPRCSYETPGRVKFSEKSLHPTNLRHYGVVSFCFKKVLPSSLWISKMYCHVHVTKPVLSETHSLYADNIVIKY